MGERIDETRLRELLPGTWNVAATNLPTWDDVDHQVSSVTYETLETSPLVIEEYAELRSSEGQERHFMGRSAWRHDTFVRRGRSRSPRARGRWSVLGATADGSVAVIRVERSRRTPDRVDVLLRSDSSETEVRRAVARDPQALGLTPEQFGSLTWIAVPDSGLHAEKSPDNV